MKRCNVCGAENEDGFTSCLICGAPLVTKEAGAAADSGDEVTTLIEPLDGKGKSSFKLKEAGSGFGQPQSSYQTAGQPAAGYGQPQVGRNTNQPVKADKKKIFLALGAITLVTVLVFVLIFAVKGGGGASKKTAKTGVDSAEEVVRSYIEGLDTQDIEVIVNLCPPFAEPDRENMESSLDELAQYNTGCTFVTVDGTYDYDSSDLSDLEDEINREYNTEVELEAACEITYTYNLSMDYMGESASEYFQEISTVIKCQGKWFLYE